MFDQTRRLKIPNVLNMQNPEQGVVLVKIKCVSMRYEASSVKLLDIIYNQE